MLHGLSCIFWYALLCVWVISNMYSIFDDHMYNMYNYWVNHNFKYYLLKQHA